MEPFWERSALGRWRRSGGSSGARRVRVASVFIAAAATRGEAATAGAEKPELRARSKENLRDIRRREGGRREEEEEG